MFQQGSSLTPMYSGRGYERIRVKSSKSPGETFREFFSTTQPVALFILGGSIIGSQN